MNVVLWYQSNSRKEPLDVMYVRNKVEENISNHINTTHREEYFSLGIMANAKVPSLIPHGGGMMMVYDNQSSLTNYMKTTSFSMSGAVTLDREGKIHICLDYLTPKIYKQLGKRNKYKVFDKIRHFLYQKFL